MSEIVKIVLIVVVIAVVVVGILIFGTGTRQDQVQNSKNEASVAMNAFHWGWVPEILESAPGVRVEVAPGAQGSKVFVPQGTKLTLVLRNAAATPELHESYEDRFREFFMEKYGDAWMNVHNMGHDADEANEDSHDNESMEGMDESMMDHAYFLEGYDVNIFLSHEPENSEQIVELFLDRAGEYKFMCVNMCGLGHGDMQGTLVVQ